MLDDMNNWDVVGGKKESAEDLCGPRAAADGEGARPTRALALGPTAHDMAACLGRAM